MKQVVWVIEDDDSIAEVVQLILEEEGCDVRVCTNYLTEKKLFATWPQPHIVLLDILMSGIDGRDIARELREKILITPAPIYFVSANNRIEEMVEEAGVQGYVRKPFDIDELIALVKKHSATTLPH